MPGPGRVAHHPGFDQFHISQGPQGNIENHAHPLYRRDHGHTVEQIKAHAYDGDRDGCTGVAQLINELVNGLLIGDRNLGSHEGSRLHDLITGENTRNRAEAFRRAAQAGDHPSVTWALDQSTERLTLTVPLGNASHELFQDAPAAGTHTLTLSEARNHIVLTLSYAHLKSARDNIRPQYVGDFCSSAITQVKHAIQHHAPERFNPRHAVGMGGEEGEFGERGLEHRGRRHRHNGRGAKSDASSSACESGGVYYTPDIVPSRKGSRQRPAGGRGSGAGDRKDSRLHKPLPSIPPHRHPLRVNSDQTGSLSSAQEYPTAWHPHGSGGGAESDALFSTGGAGGWGQRPVSAAAHPQRRRRRKRTFRRRPLPSIPRASSRDRTLENRIRILEKQTRQLEEQNRQLQASRNSYKRTMTDLTKQMRRGVAACQQGAAAAGPERSNR